MKRKERETSAIAQSISPKARASRDAASRARDAWLARARVIVAIRTSGDHYLSN